MENMNLEIKNVHIRIEDDGISLKSKQLAMGIVVKSLTLNPTNATFQKAFINPEERKKGKLSFSLIQLQGLGFYFDIAPAGNTILSKPLTRHSALEMWSLKEEAQTWNPTQFTFKSQEVLNNLENKEYLRVSSYSKDCLRLTYVLVVHTEADKCPATEDKLPGRAQGYDSSSEYQGHAS